MKYTAAALVLLLSLLFPTSIRAEEAADLLDISLELSNAKSASALLDDSYSSSVSFAAGDTVTVTAPDAMYGIYIKWNAVPDSWTLSYGDTTVPCGQNGFLHEFIAVPEGTTSCTITLNANESICDIYACSKGTIPDNIQVWNPPCEKADFLVFSTHADDEILFLGGVLATYGGEQKLAMQVVYMCEFNSTAKVREHEKLDGLWRSGITNYPINGNFPDRYCETLDGAKKIYDYNELLSFVTENIRRFQPMVCVTQDLNGEYGHGGHIILANAVSEAVTISMDSSQFPESANAYGIWDVPKTYLHLYQENAITLNLRVPLANMNNETALEVAAAAYKEHVSQQWCWFYVSDDYEYSCADFGLYRSTVGNDTGNDMLENIKTYEQQEKELREAQEKESREAYEASRQAALDAEEASKKAYEESLSDSEKTENKERAKNTIAVLAVIIGIIVIALLLIKYMTSKRRHHKR